MRANERLFAPRLFVDIVEYTKRMHAGAHRDEDEFLSNEHPLVAICQDALEQFTSNAVGLRITGFGPRSRRALAQLRRRLERRDAASSLLRLVLRFEEVGAVLGNTSYARSDAPAVEFIEDEFVSLLDAIVHYLEDTQPSSTELEAAQYALDELQYQLGERP